MKQAALVWVALAIALRIGANLAVQNLGFSAISDDDYARIVIAQQFAHAPTWDASGTSWLPFPFWLTGLAMAVFGTHLEVAHTLAWLTSLACVPAMYFAARWCGQTSRWAGWSACAFALFAPAVWLDLATVPEGYAAVLAVLALAACSRPARWQKLVAVACITAATLSRYELWPAALVVAGAQAFGTTRRPLERWLFASSSLVGPATWLLHGCVNHEHALFFLTRVANYRKLIGQAPETWFEVLTNYPLALVLGAPELVGLCLLTTGVVLGLARRRGLLFIDWRPLTPPVFGAVAVFLFLLGADAVNGAPTHHPERALQVCWLVALLGLGLVWQNSNLRGRPWAVTTFAAPALLALGLARTQAQHFVDRTREIALGQSVAKLVSDSNRLFVETQDYGYLAVAAGSHAPWHIVGFNRNDPRQNTEMWASPDALRAFLSNQRVRFLIVPDDRLHVATQVAAISATTGIGTLLDTQ